MHFDKSFFISLATHTPERIERFYKRSKKENLSVELWPGIYGLDVNIKEYQDKGYLTDAKIIFNVDVEIGKDQLILDELPDNPGHFVAADFHNGSGYLDFRHGGSLALS